MPSSCIVRRATRLVGFFWTKGLLKGLLDRQLDGRIETVGGRYDLTGLTGTIGSGGWEPGLESGGSAATDSLADF